ncbi:hypothetical protein NW762_012822 [Fusarium torreyae]|uniref:Ankyrin n=1 Tax=Fusarium torreyae TaxID=1237075 RepID=A0A9W8RQ01_9HYPO|nr:hypothetical protein NW762_012822 [Fusarium torreyae]
MGRTPLSMAPEHGHEAFVKVLLDLSSIEPDLKDRGDRTLLSLAARPWGYPVYDSHASVISRLMAQDGVDVNARDKTGKTPFSHAVTAGCQAVALLKTLQSKEADINTRDDDGQTPLSRAAQRGNADVIEFLLASADIDPHTTNNNGLTAMDIAVKERDNSSWLGWYKERFEEIIGLLSSVKTPVSSNKQYAWGKKVISLDHSVQMNVQV